MCACVCVAVVVKAARSGKTEVRKDTAKAFIVGDRSRKVEAVFCRYGHNRSVMFAMVGIQRGDRNRYGIGM